MPSILLTIDRRSLVKSSRSRYARRASSSASLGIGTIEQTRGSPLSQAIKVRSNISASIMSVFARRARRSTGRLVEKLAAIQMIDVELPTTDGRTVVLSRRTEPENDQWLLPQRLKLDLPAQPQPKITAPIPRRRLRQAVPDARLLSGGWALCRVQKRPRNNTPRPVVTLTGKSAGMWIGAARQHHRFVELSAPRGAATFSRVRHGQLPQPRPSPAVQRPIIQGRARHCDRPAVHDSSLHSSCAGAGRAADQPARRRWRAAFDRRRRRSRPSARRTGSRGAGPDYRHACRRMGVDRAEPGSFGGKRADNRSPTASRGHRPQPCRPADAHRLGAHRRAMGEVLAARKCPPDRGVGATTTSLPQASSSIPTRSWIGEPKTRLTRTIFAVSG